MSSGEDFIQRAELLADLGRYEDAAAEVAQLIASEPDNAQALTLLARIHLAADRPAEAIVAADAAVAADPRDLAALAVRGNTLTELNRFSEAAQIADQILSLYPEDPYAQTSAAAILADVRNDQRAMDAAWRGVQLAPEFATAHLVLGMVSARMQLFELAERAYREALRLDPELADARHDIGIIRLEQRRYTEALEHLAEAAVADPSNIDTGDGLRDGVRHVLYAGAGYALVAPVLAACYGGGAGEGNQHSFVWRLMVMLLAAVGFVGLGVFVSRLPPRARQIMPTLLRADRELAVAAGAVAAAPCLILLHALVGSPWPLVAAIVAGAVALLSNTWGFRFR